MGGFVPTLTSTLQLWLGTVYGGVIVGGSTVLGGVTVSAADIGAWVTVIGAGPSNGLSNLPPGGKPTTNLMLIAKIVGISGPNAILSVAADATGGSDGTAATTTIYRLVTHNDPHKQVLTGSIAANLTLTARDTASFSLISPDGSFLPSGLRGTPVLLTSTDSTVGNVFGGVIQQVKATNYPKSAALQIDCECVSWEIVFSENLLYPTQTFTGMTLRQIAQALVFGVQGAGFGDTGVSANGFSLTCPVGPVIPNESFSALTDCNSAMDQLCSDASVLSASPKLNLYWYVGPFKNVVVTAQQTNPSPWAIDDTLNQGNILAQLTANYTEEKLANRVYVSGYQIGPLQSEVFHGDDSTTLWTTQNPILVAPIVYLNPGEVYGDLMMGSATNTALSPSHPFFVAGKASQVGRVLTILGGGDGLHPNEWVPQVVKIASVVTSGINTGLATFTTVGGGAVVLGIANSTSGQAVYGGTEQTVGVLNVDTGKDWYWSIGASYVTGDGGTPLTTAEYLGVFYPSTVQNTAFWQDDAGVDAISALCGGTGFRDTSVQLSSTGTVSDLVAVAQQEAAVLSVPPVVVEIDTYKGGLFPAQLLSVRLTPFGINTDFLIDTVTLSTRDNLVLWNVRCVDGALYGDWRTAFINLARPGAGLISGGGSSEGTAAASPGVLTFTPALTQYGSLDVNNVEIGAPFTLTGIDWYVVGIDELTADVSAAITASVNSTTDPVTVTATENANRTTPTNTLDFTAGQWVLWNDAGQFEIGQLTAVSSTGTFPNRTFTFVIARHYPGEAAGKSTFEAPMTAHATNTGLFILQVQRFLFNSQTGGFNAASPPTTFSFSPLPAYCVAAVLGAAYNGTAYGDWTTYNCATATLPGIRTLVGGEFSFQVPGALVAATGVNAAVNFAIPFSQPIRVMLATADVAPTGASLKVNARLSVDGGTTWTLLEQEVIAAAAKISWNPLTPPQDQQQPYSGAWPFPVLPGGGLLNITVEQVGSTIAGSNLTVKIDT